MNRNMRAGGTLAARNRQALMVIGMHRSGTSAMMGAMQRVGVHLGGTMMKPTNDNAKGYFENLKFTEINEGILNSLGARWDSPCELKEGWLSEPSIEGYRTRIISTVKAELAETTLWGLKDPRLSRIFPIYLDAAASIGAEVGVVVMLRHPLEVARSIAKRDGIGEEHAVLLWLLYNLEAEFHTRTVNRIFVKYDELLSDCVAVVERVVGGLGLRIDVDAPNLEALREFISVSLRHHSFVKDYTRGGILRSAAEEVFHLLSAESLDIDALDAKRQSLTELLRMMRRPDGRIALEAESTSELELYARWLSSKAPTEGYAKIFVERMILEWGWRPSFHLITILRSLEDTQCFAKTFESLRGQLYRGWGVSIISFLECQFERFDALQNVEWIHVTGDPFAAAKGVIGKSEADWIAYIEPGDQLEPHALATVADYGNIRPRWLFVYCDEGAVQDDGTKAEPVFKPEFNLDLARSMPFVGRFALIKRDALQELGGFGQSSVRQHDLALRVCDAFGNEAIGHVTDVLYHRSQRGWIEYLTESEEDTRDIVGEHLLRNGVAATIGEGFLPGTLRIVYDRNDEPLVTVIIPNKNSFDILRECVDTLMNRTSYKHFEVVIVDNGSDDEDVVRYYEGLRKRFRDRVRIVEMPGEFNFSSMNNRAAEFARGEYLVLLNNDTQIVQAEWIQRMLHHAMRPEVGVVGARLVFPGSDRLQHAGVILGLQGPANHIFLGASMKEPGYMGRAQVDQEFSAVTAACMMVRKSVYSEVGGLDEEAFKVSYNDVDFCLRVRERGYKVVWTPYATVVHHGSVSQKKQLDAGSEERRERFRNEQAAMYERWLPVIASDPAYNVNLSLTSLQGEVEGELVASWDVTFHDRPRIIGQPLSPGASGDYRVVGPLAGLDRSGKAQTMTLWPLEGTARKKPRVPSIAEMARLAPDVLLMQSTIAEEYFDALAHYKKYLGLFQVYDLEDLKLVEGIPDWNSRKRYLPKDMEKLVRRGLSLCDRLLVTTEPLAEVHRKDIDDIRVVPNYLDGSKWRDLTSKRRAGRKPRVGWAGAQQHHGDLEIVTSVVKETANEIEWVFFGLWPKELEPYIETHAFGSYEEYPARLASLNLDLAIAPLERNPFNIAKSNLRLLEYGILGIPVVCSDIEPYRGDAPVKRVANTHQEWLAAIRERIHDLDATAKEGDELREWVRNHWMLEDHLDEYLRALMP